MVQYAKVKISMSQPKSTFLPLEIQVKVVSFQSKKGFKKSCTVTLARAVIAVETVLRLPEYTAAINNPGTPGAFRKSSNTMKGIS